MAVAVQERRQGSECNDAVSFPMSLTPLHCAALTGDDDRVR